MRGNQSLGQSLIGCLIGAPYCGNCQAADADWDAGAVLQQKKDLHMQGMLLMQAMQTGHNQAVRPQDSNPPPMQTLNPIHKEGFLSRALAG